MPPFKIINDHRGKHSVIKHLACCVKGSGIWDQTLESLKKEKNQSQQQYKDNIGKVNL